MFVWLIALAGAEPYGHGTDLLDHMEGHFAAATDASWYAAVGQLDAMREAARRLDHDPVSSLPKAWRAQARQMQKAAKAVVAAEDVEAGARAVAALGATCAGCHVANPKGPRLTADEVKMQVLTPLGQHALSPYWLWVGFVLNSDVAWSNGARAMVAAPIAPGTEPFVAGFDALALKVKSATPPEREARMSEVLTSCVPCHHAAGVRPEP